MTNVLEKSTLCTDDDPDLWEFYSVKGVVVDAKGRVALVRKVENGKFVYSLIGGKYKDGEGDFKDVFRREVLEEGGITLGDDSVSVEYALDVKGRTFAVLSGEMQFRAQKKRKLSKKEKKAKLKVKFYEPEKALKLVGQNKKRSVYRDCVMSLF